MGGTGGGWEMTHIAFSTRSGALEFSSKTANPSSASTDSPSYAEPTAKRVSDSAQSRLQHPKALTSSSTRSNALRASVNSFSLQ
jgi:hypothetical protein